MDVTLPDGTVIRDVPDGMSKADLTLKLKNNGYDVSKLETQEPSMLQKVGQQIGNVGAGALRGAGSIGATAMRILPNALGGDTAAENEVRRQQMDAALQSMGAEPDSIGYQGGKIASEIAGTAGAGGVLAKGLSAIPGVAKYAAPLIEALRTGGMSAGGSTGAKALATRVVGGGATGGGAAALANPEDATTGMAVGGALPLIGPLLRGAGTIAKKAIGGTTGVGDEALNQALRAGKEGGKVAQDFTAALRGESNMDDVLTMAKQNLEAMGQQKQAAYRQGMAGIKADKTVLDLSNIDKSVNDAVSMATYKGQIKNEKAASALSQIKGEVDNWKSLDPAEFHTPEGLDALKQKIGGILEEIPYEQKTARSAAGKVYDAVRSEINAQAPEYSKVMKGYSEASDTIKEIERALSQGQKASADTAMRKLQSLMRNNVNTNYGQRAKLAQEMIAAGGQDFMPALAGQALNDFTPRGIQRAGVGTGSAGLALTGNIPAAVALPFVSSPRLIGEAFYGAGKAAGAVNPAIIEALRKAGYRSAPIAASSE